MTLAKCDVIIIFVSFVRFSDGAMEGFVVGGNYGVIKSYPHSVFLAISCVQNNAASYYICGSSVLNQHFALTAAHCLETCKRGSRISAAAGNENREIGSKTSALSFRIHEEYARRTMKADIGIVRVRTPFRLSMKVKRVVLVRKTPHVGSAVVAGWGIVDEKKGTGTTRLKYTQQALWTRKECFEVLRNIPTGTICAGTQKGRDFASEGDSGSALMVRGYIQVGLVSYKVPTVSRSLSVYTEVAYYYDWVQRITRSLYCA